MKNIFAFLKKIPSTLRKWLAKPMPMLEKVEEGYHFPFSHLFFSIISWVGILAICAGFFIFLYSIIPVFERSVDEPELLSQREITVEDVLSCAKPVQSKMKKRTTSHTSPTSNTNTTYPGLESCPMPQISLANLASALPGVTFSKKGRKNICDKSEGYYEYGDWGDFIYPSRCYEYGDIDSKFSENVREKMRQWFPCDSAVQQEIVNKIASHLMSYAEKSRLQIYKTSINWIERAEDINAVTETFEIFAAVDAVIGNAGNENVTQNVESLFAAFENFMGKNPRNGKQVLFKSLELMKIADGSKRLDVFKTARAYYKEIDIDMDASGEWAKASDRFLVLKELHVGSNIVNNIKCFYDAYIKEASDRVAENKRRERSYESEVSNAKFEAEAARLKHRAAMPVSGIVALAGLALFIVIGILLLLFSLQRSVKHLEKIIAEKDKTKE